MSNEETKICLKHPNTNVQYKSSACPLCAAEERVIELTKEAHYLVDRIVAGNEIIMKLKPDLGFVQNKG